MPQHPILPIKQDEEEPSSSGAQTHISRRNVLISGAAMAATLTLPNAAFAFQPETIKPKSGSQGDTVNTLTVKDGNTIYYKTGALVSPSSFRTAGRSPLMHGMRRCSSSGSTAIEWSLMIGAAMGVPVNHGTVTIWTPTPMISRSCSRS